tara:strand:- start:14031 stop:14810 length:780 start_codon:yes stop_codon:yes gene_type:complete
MDFLMDTLFRTMTSHVWVFTRIGGFLMAMPVVGTRWVPQRVRLLAAVAMTVALVPMLPEPEAIPLLSLNGFLVTIQQVIIGMSMGFMLNVFIQIFNFAGFLIGMQSSLGFAAMVDPNNGQQVPVVAHYYQIFSLLLFFLFDGHLIMFQILFYSFESLPIALKTFAALDFESVARWTSTIFKSGLLMALSGIVALMLINFSFGVMTRASPQLNIFSVGFPITMLCGIFILWLTVINVYHYYPHLWSTLEDKVCAFTLQSC